MRRTLAIFCVARAFVRVNSQKPAPPAAGAAFCYVNIANTPVSVNTINNGGNGITPQNSNLYISNTNNARALEFGGLTVSLTAQVLNLSPGITALKSRSLMPQTEI